MAVTTETRDVTGFSSVALRGLGDATLIQGAEEGLVIEADEEIISRIRSEVRDGRLVLGLDLAWWEWLTWWFTWLFTPNKQVRYTVRLCDFADASISGSGKVIAGDLRGANCRFSISGSGKITSTTWKPMRSKRGSAGRATSRWAGTRGSRRSTSAGQAPSRTVTSRRPKPISTSAGRVRPRCMRRRALA